MTAKHREEQRRYWLSHKEQVNERNKRWKQAHPEYMSAYLKKWRAANREKVAEEHRLWRMTPKGRLSRQRGNFRRRGPEGAARSGVFILNRPFEGSHLHHLENRIGVYIPESLHKSIWHNLRTGQGMIEINQAVSNWMEAQTA